MKFLLKVICSSSFMKTYLHTWNFGKWSVTQLMIIPLIQGNTKVMLLVTILYKILQTGSYFVGRDDDWAKATRENNEFSKFRVELSLTYEDLSWNIKYISNNCSLCLFFDCVFYHFNKPNRILARKTVNDTFYLHRELIYQFQYQILSGRL